MAAVNIVGGCAGKTRSIPAVCFRPHAGARPRHHHGARKPGPAGGWGSGGRGPGHEPGRPLAVGLSGAARRAAGVRPRPPGPGRPRRDPAARARSPASGWGSRPSRAWPQGLGKPCLGLSALDVLASLVPRRPAVALLDAWRNEVYAGVYPARCRPHPPYAGPLEGLAARCPPGAVIHRRRGRPLPWATARPSGPRPAHRGPDLFLAAPLGRLAEPMLAAGRGHGPEALAPLYLRSADIRLPSS